MYSGSLSCLWSSSASKNSSSLSSSSNFAPCMALFTSFLSGAVESSIVLFSVWRGDGWIDGATPAPLIAPPFIERADRLDLSDAADL